MLRTSAHARQEAMAPKDLKHELLKKVPLFRTCSDRDIDLIEGLTDDIDVPDGKVIIKEGVYGHEFFIVIAGKLDVTREGKHLRDLGPGEFAGEIALIDGGLRTATVTAAMPSRLLVLGRREFNSLLEQYPQIQIEVLQALAHRVRVLEPDAVH
jgi:CRP/FNR family cyclic AMP-dependent transcriptional regulator